MATRPYSVSSSLAHIFPSHSLTTPHPCILTALHPCSAHMQLRVHARSPSLIAPCSYLCSESVLSGSVCSSVCPDSQLSIAPSSACFLRVFLSRHPSLLSLNPPLHASYGLSYSPQQLRATVETAALRPSILYVSMPRGRWARLLSSPPPHSLVNALSVSLCSSLLPQVQMRISTPPMSSDMFLPFEKLASLF